MQVNLVLGWVALLSGRLNQCFNATDPTCSGGMAGLAAISRFYQADDTQTLVLPFVDKQSPFVQMHPLGWSLNRLIFKNLMGWGTYLTSPSILTQNSVDFEVSQRDISDLQATDLPLLLTNVVVPPRNSWNQYTEPVYFDGATGLAVMWVSRNTEFHNVPQVESVTGTLNYVHRKNVESGCMQGSRLFDEYGRPSPSGNCWIPIVVYGDHDVNLIPFVEAILEVDHPPAMIIDVEGHLPEYNIPRRAGPTGVWIHSEEKSVRVFQQHNLEIAENGIDLKNVTLITLPYQNMTNAMRDPTYEFHISYLRTLADEAVENDPVIGETTAVPLHREGSYRRCMGGECELGNLFADSLRWWTKADVAFVTSGGLRGDGWDAGEVRVSNIWNSLPFPNTVCIGTFTGVSLFELYNYSIGAATFQNQLTETGGALLQSSGLRVTYNSELIGSRIIALDVWNATTSQYEPVDRLRLYKFATDSYLCGANDPFPSLLTTNLVFQGEDQGFITGDLHQDVVANFLRTYQLENDEPYDPSPSGRMVNDTSEEVPLNLVQSEEDCGSGFFWNADWYTCQACPTGNVHFLSDRVALEGRISDETELHAEIDIVNGEAHTIALEPLSFPTWFETEQGEDGTVLYRVGPGERATLRFVVNTKNLSTGTATATVAFSIADGSRSTSCPSRDVSFEVAMRIVPRDELNQLGSSRAIGFSMTAIVSCTAFWCFFWVWKNRQLRIVKTMQPSFLMAITFGIFIMGLSLIPLSIDDSLASAKGSDMACMATVWLSSIGFTIAQSALFSKLWRINRLFNTPLRRMQIQERDVLGPFAALFAVNLTILMVMTIVDPIQFERVKVEGEEWKSYGVCSSNGVAAVILYTLNISVNACALGSAAFQAYKARKISDEFSESKALGIAMFSWVELLLVGIPVMFLIDRDNPTARYFILASFVFVGCESMLLFTFVPIFGHIKTVYVQSRRNLMNGTHFKVSHIGQTRISGLNFAGTSNFAVNDAESLREDESVPHKSRTCTTTNAASSLSEVAEEDDEDCSAFVKPEKKVVTFETEDDDLPSSKDTGDVESPLEEETKDS